MSLVYLLKCLVKGKGGDFVLKSTAKKLGKGKVKSEMAPVIIVASCKEAEYSLMCIYVYRQSY